MAHPDVILAGASVRSLAQSAIRDGLKPLCVDMFGDEDLRRLLSDEFGTTDRLIVSERFCDVPSLVIGVPRNVPLIAVGGLENDSRLMAPLRQQRPVCGPADSVIQDLKNPLSLFPALQNAGCRTPRFHMAAADAVGDRRWLKKTIHSAGGQGVQRFEANASPVSVANDNSFLQEFIDGIPMSATFSGDGTNVCLIGCALQFSGLEPLNAPPFLFCGNAGPMPVSADLRQQFVNIGQCIVDRWAMCGLFGVDVIVRDGRAFVIEVNPRLTASHELHEFSNIDAVGHVALQLAAGQHHHGLRKQRTQNPAVGQSTPPMVTRLVVYADRDRRISETEQSALLKQCRKPDQSPPVVWLADIPRAGTIVPEGTPFCSVYLAERAYQSPHAVQNSLSDLFSPEILQLLVNMSTQIQGISKLL